MKNLHSIEEPRRPDRLTEMFEEFARNPPTWWNDFTRPQPRDVGILRHLDRQIDRLLMLGVRVGEVALLVTPDEYRLWRESMVGIYFQAGGVDRYRGWPLAVVR